MLANKGQDFQNFETISSVTTIGSVHGPSSKNLCRLFGLFQSPTLLLRHVSAKKQGQSPGPSYVQLSRRDKECNIGMAGLSVANTC